MNGEFCNSVEKLFKDYNVIKVYASPKEPLWNKNNSIEVIAISELFGDTSAEEEFRLSLITTISSVNVEAIHPYFSEFNSEYSENSMKEQGLFPIYTQENGWLYNR